jgi:hypothetical protein
MTQHLAKDLLKALRQWSNGKRAIPLDYLYLYRKALRNGASTPQQATNHVLYQGLLELKQHHEAAAALLEMRFLDGKKMQYLTNSFNVAESTLFSMQRNAVTQLTETIQHQEQAAIAAQQHLLCCRLEGTTYQQLVGVEAQIAELQQVVTQPGPPWLIAIEGIGGIGKTSLADALLRRLIGMAAFDEIGWVSARRQRLALNGDIHSVAQPVELAHQVITHLARQLAPELVIHNEHTLEQLLAILQSRLQRTPHLIVIDNLETLQDVESLLPTLNSLANPSKFLLTSRTKLFAEPGVHHFPVGELSEADALRLIRQEATGGGQPELAACRDAELRAIYATVGGNPLALRLVVGQTLIHPLHTVLAQLQRARGKSVETLYTYIFWQAWERLDPLSRDVWLILPLGNPGGDDLAYLAEVGDLAEDTVRMALNKLVTYNLVDARGGVEDRRYSIHGLTRTFLKEQVARWKP